VIPGGPTKRAMLVILIVTGLLGGCSSSRPTAAAGQWNGSARFVGSGAVIRIEPSQVIAAYLVRHRFDPQCGRDAAVSTATTINGRGVTQSDLVPLSQSLPRALGDADGGEMFSGPRFGRLEVLVTDESRARAVLATVGRALCMHIDAVKVPYSKQYLSSVARALTNHARSQHFVINAMSPDPRTDQLIVQVPAHATDAAGHTGAPDPSANYAKVLAAARPFGKAVVITRADRVLAAG